MTTEELNIKITADTSAATSNIGKAEKSVNDLGKSSKGAADKIDKLDKSVTTTGGSLRTFGQEADTAGNRLQSLEGKANGLNFSGLKSTLVGLGLGKMLKDSITNAMDAVESESLFETSLGGLSSQARSWSEKLSSDLGLDGYALRKNVGMLYTMTSSMGLGTQTAYEMSTSLTQLAEDMASFYNLSSEEAFGKLKSGLTGEAEPLKALGILVDENTVKQYAYKNGIAEVGSELTQQQKVLARYQAILGQTATAQGDLARTADSPANQLRRTMNELQQASIEVGTALMPLVQVALPIVRSVISDIAPLIKDVAGGVSFLGGALKIMENPAMKAIAYAVAAVGIVKKLNMALGGPTSKLILLLTLLSAFVGSVSSADEEGIASIAPEMDNASASTDKATDSANDFAKGLGEVEKAAARLASFDKITKLNGGSSGTLASKFVNSDDLNTFSEYAKKLESYYDNIQKITEDNYGFNPVASFDWDTFKKDLEETTADIKNAFFGSGEEQYEALKKLNEKIKNIFGPEFTEFWNGVGNDIYNVFNGSAEESYNALVSLNEKMKKIPFWDSISPFFQKLGGGLFDLTNGFNQLGQGNTDGALASFGKFMEAVSPLMGDKKEVVENSGKALSTYFTAKENGDTATLSVLEGQYWGTWQSGLKAINDWTVNEFFKNNPLLDDFGGAAEGWSDFFQEVGRKTQQAGGSVFGGVAANIAPSLNMPQFSSPNIGMEALRNVRSNEGVPLDATAIYKALSAAGTPTSVIKIQTDVNLDGEKIGEAVYDYDSKKSAATNGR